MSSQIYQFGKTPFTFQEFITKTKYKESYGRNLINKLAKKNIIETLPNQEDKRSRLYRLNWKKIKELIILGGKERENIINNLDLEQYLHEYVALKNFEVIDHDIDLFLLTQRIYRKGSDPDIVVTNVGIPKKMIIHEFG
ncbi:MAG: hypothetical protein ACTSO9_15140 [Candidatus Helarchaeota archaeon]